MSQQPQVIGYATPATYVSTFFPSAGRAKVAMICIGITVVLSIVVSAFGWALTWVVDLEAINSGAAPPPSAVAFFLGLAFVGLLKLISYVCAAVFFLRWQHRAHRNLYALGQIPTYTPGWGVGYWFIPFANLVAPYRELRNLSELSDPARRGFQAIGAYWACWIIGNILTNISTRLPETPGARTAVLVIDLLALVLEIAAAVLVFKLISFVVESQARLSSTQAAVVSPN